jgi:hypothetical protein
MSLFKCTHSTFKASIALTISANNLDYLKIIPDSYHITISVTVFFDIFYFTLSPSNSIFHCKIYAPNWVHWFKPIILATWEVEIRGVGFEAKLGKTSSDPIQLMVGCGGMCLSFKLHK